MKLDPTPFTATDWSAIPPTRHPGETGEATWRTLTIGDVRWLEHYGFSPFAAPNPASGLS